MSDSCLQVSSWGLVGGYLLRTLPQGLRRALLSLLLVPWGFQVTGGLYFCFPGDVSWASALPFFFWASPCWGSWCFATCQGAPVEVCSAWFAGEVPLLPFPYLRVGVLLA